MVPLKYHGETLDAGRIPTLKLAPAPISINCYMYKAILFEK
jgi:hypothetical protein